VPAGQTKTADVVWPAAPAGLQWADVVEKVGGALTTRNNRIAHDDFLNLSCGLDARFESILLTAPLKIVFRQMG
jgi:hypothetical protein